MENRNKLMTYAPLFLVIIVDAIGMGIVFPVLSGLVVDTSAGLLPVGASKAMGDLIYGLIIGVFSLFMLFGAPFFGDLSDRIGRKKSLLICLFITAFSFLICALGIQTASIALLLVGRALDGFSAGSGAIAQAAIIDISTQEEKTKNIALITMAFCIGFVLGPIVGGYFAEHNFLFIEGYAAPFYLAMGLALLNTVLLQVFFHETHEIKAQTKLRLFRGFEIFLDAFRTVNLRHLAYILLFMELGWSIYFQYVSLFLTQEHAYSTADIGKFMSFVGLIFTISLTVIIRLALKFVSEKKLLRINLLIAGIATIMASYSISAWSQWWYCIPISISGAISYTLLLTFFSNKASSEHQGWVMGVANAVIAVSWLLGAVGAGLISPLGSGLPFIFAGIITIVSYFLARRYV